MPTRTYIGAQAVVLLTTVLVTILSGSVLQAEDNPSKEELIKKLECRADQPCESPPASRRRGFQAPSQAKRGISFEPFTEQERKKIDEDARAGKLPTADLEVFFDYDKAEVTPTARQTLGPLGQALIDPKLVGYRFVLVGHTDAKGGDAYNQILSERRAAAVKEHLVRTFGIAPERLVTYGRGKSLLKNTADPFTAENRRVQVINQGALAGADHKP